MAWRFALAAGLALAPAPLTAQARPPSAAQACEALSGAALPSSRIGLPTRGATVLDARLVEASEAPGRRAPQYCRVLGAIRPVDRRAPDIRFELDLPTSWNGKAFMEGGGGFDGAIPDTAGPLLDLPGGRVAPPLMRGYATFGSDSGHQAENPDLPTPAVDGAFALNDEALANYAGDAIKKTRDVAIALIARRYGRPPARTYFAGSSNGGREALVAVQRWPRDFDGAIAAFPFWKAGTNALAFGAIRRALAAPGAYPNPAKRLLVETAAVRACDRLDGLSDGVVANVEACRFDPLTLRCASGFDTGDACLSDAQIEALRVYAGPFVFPGPTRLQGRGYPGYAVLAGAEIADEGQLGTHAPGLPPPRGAPLAALYWDQLVRYAIARDPAFDPGSLDPAHPGRLGPRLDRVTDMLDADDRGLGPFRDRGGKLIVYHGLADPLVSHRATEAAWQVLERTMGAAAVREFARFYVIPGYGHGAGAFLPIWDPLGVLEAWAEHDLAPGDLTMTDGSAVGHGRRRPLCEHRHWPRYDGTGDPAKAESFRCQADTPADG